MILVTGGSSQGKREFVRQYLGGPDREPVVWTEGAEASWEEFMEGRFCRDFQLFVRRVMEESVGPWGREPDGPVTEQLLKELLAGPEDRVLVTDETGCGIVPADAFERLYREENGRLCCRIAGEAEEVWWVCCGIGMRIK
ncbi:MAG: bifunctional adenosylcobinamide kinase/adenosylcobinamide-phosphate guanylyltransferase [Clostridia bacterium]|nr:bifunctional adenosylcobinamide kinase/adenosylcobinamide-phosphate guanylyltransferase [Clostridia bacterium]